MSSDEAGSASAPRPVFGFRRSRCLCQSDSVIRASVGSRTLRCTRTRLALIVWICGFPGGAWAQWQSIGSGLEYREFTVSGPNRAFVARLDRDHPDAFIESSIAQGRLISGRETVSGMAARYEDTIAYWDQQWGTRNDVVVAVNGDFFNLSTGVPTSGQIQSGWYAKRFSDFTGGSGFAWQLDRDVFIGGCVHNISGRNFVTYPAGGQTQNIAGINTPPAADKLTMYTPQFDVRTDTDSSVSEVLVQLDEPALIKPGPAFVRGTVREIHILQGSTTIPFDSIVLSAHGQAATKLLANAAIGAELRISQEVTHYEHDCNTPNPDDWTKTYAAIGGSFHFLISGVIQSSTDPGATQRHPRTAVAYNDDFVFFIVVDGRSSQSVGMNMTELGSFCLTHLGATDGINQDGGGSSTMWVNGQIKNVPSDGTQRAVANGLMMVVRQPKQQSTTLAAAAPVRTASTASVRLGPGANYAALSSVAAGTEGTVSDHPLIGVLATGDFWWKCRFDDVEGWVTEDQLETVLPRTPDLDDDGDVDLVDYGLFQACVSGRFIPQHDEACHRARFDDDADIDEDDLDVLLNCLSGAGVPYNPTCIGD